MKQKRTLTTYKQLTMLKNIWKYKNVLSVCTHSIIRLVLVLQLSNTPVNGLENVALKKPTVQSSTWFGVPAGFATLANDGKSYPHYYDGSCSHTDLAYDTQRNQPGWWMVDLLQPYIVESVKVTSRGDWHYPLLNSTIYVSERNPQDDPEFPKEESMGKICVRRKEVGQGETVLLSCGTPVLGRFVTMVKWDRVYGLVLCEFQVFAQAVIVSSSNVQFSVAISAGRKSLATPVISKQGVRSLVECARVCMWKEEIGQMCNALQYKASTSLCECLQLSALHSYKRQLKDPDWKLATPI
ncbi:pentraxin fusion protein [Aplysia californica]|uniref:Pentraxin fusion protein n=1 Tax=Aplysia californica TaxID=6500 RepID=A0ABM0JYP6_APLCA|nr:pentraxin fusion protein [Aplysia californica]